MYKQTTWCKVSSIMGAVSFKSRKTLSVIGLILRSDHFLNLNIRLCDSITVWAIQVWIKYSSINWSLVVHANAVDWRGNFNSLSPIFRRPKNKTTHFFFSTSCCTFSIYCGIISRLKNFFSMPHYQCHKVYVPEVLN